MNNYQVKIDEEQLPISYTFDELIENGLLDERDEHIKIKLIGETDWVIAHDYPFSKSERTLSDNFRLNEDGSVTRNANDMANYSLNEDGSINRSGNYPKQQKPDSNMIWAIISISICLPFGILALMESVKVDSLYSDGDVNGAIRASENAKKWALWPIYVWVGIIVIGIICAIIGS